MLDVRKSLSSLVENSELPLKFYKDVKVVVRTDAQNLSGVRLISGGGAGHEPGQSGYVGKGMLTAAVSGEIFASPSVSNIVAAIQLSGPPGSEVLLIVTNYTGDRLNFGLAAEVAEKQLGYKIRTLLVNDDCSISDTNVRRSVGRRGLAGTVLIHKIAGAMSDMGKSLDEIYDFLSWHLDSRKLVTVGFSFKLNRELMTDVEIGKGLHGEPGVQTLRESYEDFSFVIGVLMEKFLIHVSKESDVLVLFNNLGGVSEIIFQRFIGDFLNEAKQVWKVIRTIAGPIFTSLSSQAISVTILDLSELLNDLIQYLEHDVKVSANFEIKTVNGNEIQKVFEFNQSSTLLYDFDTKTPCTAEKCLKNITKTVLENKELLNLIDSDLGDGDTGALASIGANQIEEALKNNRINFSSTKSMLLSVSSELQTCMGGSFGAICCLFLQGFSSVASEEFSMNEIWKRGLTEGIACVQKYSLAEVGDRTVLDVLIPLRDFFKSCEANLETKSLLKKLSEISGKAAQETLKMKPLSGRAAYSSSETTEFSSNYPDPGAYLAFLVMNSIYEAF